VHQSALSLHLLGAVLLLTLAQKLKPLLQPLAHILLPLQSKLNLILYFLIHRLQLLSQQQVLLCLSGSGLQLLR